MDEIKIRPTEGDAEEEWPGEWVGALRKSD